MNGQIRFNLSIANHRAFVKFGLVMSLTKPSFSPYLEYIHDTNRSISDPPA